MPAGTECLPATQILLHWTRHESYESARHETRVVYLFEWHDKPFYWGVADKSRFGVRYSPGYRHLVEGALRHGASLYLATVVSPPDVSLIAVENQLIVTCGHVMNSRIDTWAASLDLQHAGTLPACLRDTVESTPIAAVGPWQSTDTPSQLPGITLSADGLVVQHASGATQVEADKLLAVLDAISCRFGGETFCLDDDAERSPFAEIGFGSVVSATPVENAALVSGPLARLLADCGVLERTAGTPDRGKPARYRLLLRPTSWIELRERLERLPIASRCCSS